MKRHNLSEINPENKTAICSVCGPVCIKKHSSKQWRCKNKSIELNKIRRLNKSNISKDEYKKFIQHNPPNSFQTCGICTKGIEKNGQYLALDHCHETGKIRGYLCRECNLGLGNFKDSLILLENAIKYLKK